jgi:hypothetical protein
MYLLISMSNSIVENDKIRWAIKDYNVEIILSLYCYKILHFGLAICRIYPSLKRAEGYKVGKKDIFQLNNYNCKCIF